MFEVIEDESTLAEAQKNLRDQIQSSCDLRLPFKAGFQGGDIQQTAYWYDKEKYWGFWLDAYTASGGGRRYWNAFGVERPAAGSLHSITVEINSPLEGINRRIAGAFVKDEHGEIYLAHRGRIGGAKPGAYTKQFRVEFSDHWVDVYDGRKTNRLVIIGRIGSDDFIARLGQFIHTVARLKGQIRL